MRKNFLSFLTAIFAIALVLSAVMNAEASRQRLKGMAMDADSYWMIEKDTITTTLSPATLIGFPSLVGMNEDGSAANRNASLFWKVSDTAIFHFLTSGASSLNLYGAFGISADTTVGFNVAATTVTDTSVTKDKQTYSGTLSILQKMGSDSLDVAFTFAKVFGQDGASQAQMPDNLGTATLFVRYNMAVSEAQKLHILFKGIYDDSTITKAMTGASPAQEVVTKTYTVGLSDEVKLSDSALAYVGVYNKYISKTAKNLATGFQSDNLALHFGVEGKISDMFKARIGANKTLYSYYKGDYLPTEINNGTNTTVPATTLASGLTCRIGQLQIDWVIDVQLIKDGPYLISGKNSGTGGTVFSSDVNVAYLFDTPVIK